MAGDYEGPAIVEIMGHRRLAGVVSEVEIAGAKMLRVDVPSDPPATQFYGGGSIFCLTPCTEATMLEALAAIRVPEPVKRWELPRASEGGTFMTPGGGHHIRGADEDGDEFEEAHCRVCGCTEDDACVPACSWVPDPEGKGDLCSACLDQLTPKAGGEIDGRCHADWQGPSEEGAEDDLLVIRCLNATDGHHIHRGLMSGGEQVLWTSVAGDLTDLLGTVVRHQHAPAAKDVAASETTTSLPAAPMRWCSTHLMATPHGANGGSPCVWEDTKAVLDEHPF